MICQKTVFLKRSGVWRNAVYHGDKVLVSPKGRVYFGTRQEVRDACLSPWRRDSLARSLRFWRSQKIGYDVIRGIRRENVQRAIEEREIDLSSVTIPARMAVMVEAAARYMERSDRQFVEELIQCGIDSTRDEARGDGLDDIPLTRHEKKWLNFKGGV